MVVLIINLNCLFNTKKLGIMIRRFFIVNIEIEYVIIVDLGY